MLRTVSVLFAIGGFLICPYACIGQTGSLCGKTNPFLGGCHSAAACCDSEAEAFKTADGKTLPPCEDDRQHECVISKSTVETSQKTAREIITRSLLDSMIADFVLPTASAVSHAHETGRPVDVSTQRAPSGAQLRTILVSFLL